MTKQQARSILNRARDGGPTTVHQIRRALRITDPRRYDLAEARRRAQQQEGDAP